MPEFYYHEQLKESENSENGYSGFLFNFHAKCELKTTFNQKTGLSEKLVVTFPENPEFESVEFDKNSLVFEGGCLYGKLPEKNQFVERIISIVF